MKVSPIYSNNYYVKKNVNFASSERIVYKHLPNRTYSNFTSFLRPDFDWISFIKFIKEKYGNLTKVNIINHACSDGSEPYTLAMLIKEAFKDFAKNFLPIKAYDFDAEIINYAKNKQILIKHDDIYRLSTDIPQWNSKYLKVVQNQGMGTPIKVSPTEELDSAVVFEKKNILDDFVGQKLSNTIILTRNMWAYLRIAEQETLMEHLFESMDDSCLLVLGALEKTYGIDNMLEKRGFVKTSVDYVYTKPTFKN